ncbi:MAG: VRR-NUC domain-containing protein [Thiomonas arsenitoxydans]|nr:VRR-NUC domain-containing protein [Thiomonas arsenitoxydans]
MEAPTKRTNDRPEAAALVEVLMALRASPLVAWVERMNTGAARVGNRFIKFGFTGCPDVLGQLTDGRLLGVEVKAPKGKLRPEQAFMLARINEAGGLGFIARNCRDVFAALGQAP